MPYNPKAPDIDRPVDLKWNEEPITRYRDQLKSITVRLMNAPSIDDLLAYIPEFGTATWRDTPLASTELSENERLQIVIDLFDGKILPTALETINLTFEINSMDYIDVTHILRHRLFSFSAQCTADRDQRHDSIAVKPSIKYGDPKFYDRYRQITEAAKQLYADMIDSKEISVLDARTILPRNLETFYYIRGTIKDWFAFIGQRLDEQIQPQSDNVIAMRCFLAIVRQYPFLWNKFEIGGRDEWYIKTAPTGRSSNIYPPKVLNDLFDWKDDWFIYDKRRHEFNGNEIYEDIKQSIKQEIDFIGGTYEEIT